MEKYKHKNKKEMKVCLENKRLYIDNNDLSDLIYKHVVGAEPGKIEIIEPVICIDLVITLYYSYGQVSDININLQTPTNSAHVGIKNYNELEQSINDRLEKQREIIDEIF